MAKKGTRANACLKPVTNFILCIAVTIKQRVSGKKKLEGIVTSRMDTYERVVQYKMNG